jgi:hypothetical protein
MIYAADIARSSDIKDIAQRHGSHATPRRCAEAFLLAVIAQATLVLDQVTMHRAKPDVQRCRNSTKRPTALMSKFPDA